MKVLIMSQLPYRSEESAMKTSYRIIKLSSGEEIIGNIKGREKDKIIIDRPMIFKTQVMMHTLGTQKEVIFLKDWMSYTNDNQAKIQESHITSIFAPDELVVSMYDRAKHELDVQPDRPAKLEKLDPDKVDNKQSLEDTIKQMFKFPNQNQKNSLFDDLDALEEKLDSIHGEGNGPDDKDRIYLNMDLSYEDLKNMFDDGIISSKIFNMIEEMYYGSTNKMRPEETSNDSTIEDKDNPDYGNRWTDWDNDLSNEDYK